MRGMRAPLIAVNWALMRLSLLSVYTTCCLGAVVGLTEHLAVGYVFTTYTKTAIFLVVEQEIQPFF